MTSTQRDTHSHILTAVAEVFAQQGYTHPVYLLRGARSAPRGVGPRCGTLLRPQ